MSSREVRASKIVLGFTVAALFLAGIARPNAGGATVPREGDAGAVTTRNGSPQRVVSDGGKPAETDLAWSGRRPDHLEPVLSFDAARFAEPEAALWPGYFWLWNFALEPEVLRAQLRDMASHGARSVCMLPMPRAFRPDSMNNSMEPDYLTPEYFERVRLAVEEAAGLGMNWWLYDEGGWPSGQALGKVLEGHPELSARRVLRRLIEPAGTYVVPPDALALVVDQPEPQVISPGDTWTPGLDSKAGHLYHPTAIPRPDLLNPETTRRFIDLTHEAYRRAIGDHFGRTVRFVFTDEPAVSPPAPPQSIPWTPGLDALYAQRFAGRFVDILPALFAVPSADLPAVQARARIAFFDLWSLRFRDAYFRTLRDWSRRQGLASGGHLGGEDRTIGAVEHGFGHALRQLRAMDVPGVDVIWRQLFPGRPARHHFPKYASSAAHQNGTRFTFTESFGVYGNGLTPAQMKWLVDYQYIGGANLLVGGSYPLSTRDHHMVGVRPHFGPVNPLWDHLGGFHAYAARLGYVLSVGRPEVSVAVYYPVRDMWAWGAAATAAIASHDQLAAELLARQCDFDLIDDDLLTDRSTRVENGELVVGAMRYHTVCCGAVSWMKPEAVGCLKRFADAGGRVLCAAHAPGTDGMPGKNEARFCETGTPAELAARVTPTADLDPSSRGVRAAGRTLVDGHILVLFNEGTTAFDGTVGVQSAYVYRLNPETAEIVALAESTKRLTIRLEPAETALLLLADRRRDAQVPRRFTGESITLDERVTARPTQRFVVGDHDFEIVEPDAEAAGLAQASTWKEWVSEDYSGKVDYEVVFEIPEAWAGDPVQLDVNRIEYAATVVLDGTTAGHLLWPPWRLDLPPCGPGRHRLVLRVANTLANELTSPRVEKLWSGKRGPGWPSPYHARTIEFECQSRGGGLWGPVLIKRMRPAPPGG